MPLFTARIVLLVNANSEVAACDVISETMREWIAANQGDVIDWSYSRDNSGAFTKPYYLDTEQLNLAQLYDISAAEQSKATP